MKFETKSLRSKVARRIFLLFISCALLPVGTLAILSFYQVSGQLREQSRRQLEQASKAQGMSTYERIEMLNTELQLVGLRVTQGNPDLFEKESHERFAAIEIFNGKPEPDALFGSTFPLPKLADDQRLHLGSGKPLIQTRICSGGIGTCVEMLRLLDSEHPEKGILAGKINLNYLWGADRLSAALLICVFDHGREPLFCSHDGVARSIASGIPRQDPISSGFFDWTDKHNPYDAAYWSLFLNPQFHTTSWTIVLSQSHADALAPMSRFRGLFPFVVLLTLWVVILLSLVQIRRTLIPLELLKKGTQQIAAQRFDSRVEVRSGDEFEELAGSFNSMSLQLGRQFHALKTINEIDRAILESLDRERTIDGALSHMPYLLSASCFVIALFDDSLSAAELTITEKGRGEGQTQLKRTLDSQLSGSDLDRIRQNPDALVVDSNRALPSFLLPLADGELSSFAILPIFLDKKPYAALVCAWEGAVQIGAEEIQRARQVADQLAVAFSNIQLIEALEQFHWGTLTALARAIDAKSSWTAGHSERVTAMALRIAKTMGLPGKDLQIMQRGGLLHDIGKIGTPQTVLDKPGKLEPDEMQTMREHVRIGMRILEPIPAFKEALPIVAQHHEWFNGKGYPEGLAGEEISLHARIFAVADCYDALKSDRPYRQGLPLDRVVEMLKGGSGTQFDPRVVEAFLQNCGDAGSAQPAEPLTELAGQRV